jgi:hypothetical protein
VRTAVVIVATAGLALPAAGCGGSAGSHVAQLGTTAAASTSVQAAAAQGSGPLAFSRCMRSHGVPEFPDPNSSGGIPKESLEQLGVSSARFQSAQVACRQLLLNGGRPPDQAEQQQVEANALKFSQCVRRHGVRNFPDPDRTGRIPDPASVGIDQGSPRFQAANQACRAYRPPYMPSNSAYNAYARTQTGG